VTLLHVDQLKLFRGKQVLAEAVSFELAAGQWLELVGDNGAGKSTLLRTIAGLQKSEQVSVVGSIGWFYAPFGFRREFTVWQQLEFFSRLYQRSLSTEQILDVLQQVGLKHKADTSTAQLSQGQKARLALAQLILSGAKVWLLDEPFNALDADACQLFGNLLAMHLQTGGVAVIATHRPIVDVCKNIAAFAAMRLRLSGGVAQLETVDSVGLSFRIGSDNESPAINLKPIASSSQRAPGPPSPLQAFLWASTREWALLKASPRAAVWPAVFHSMVLCLFPLGLGSDTQFLARACAGLIWVSALLSSVLASGTLFDTDHNEGVLSAIRAAKLSLPGFAAGKVAVHGAVQAVSLSAASVVLGIQYQLEVTEALWLMLSLLIGVLSLSQLSALFAGMTLLARQSSTLVYLLALPLFVPVLVFGSSVLSSVQQGFSPQAPLFVLIALAVLLSITLPLVVGQLLSWALE
jgi:heme ABC exporter ATP-binding subunit CcmA/heme exporter protein CcmB